MYNDYFPFGMLMPGRISKSADYDRGYQGSLKDNEIAGIGNHYTTFFRELDPRLGRWWSIDPKSSAQPYQSPYCSMDNNPIFHNDVLGDEASGGPKPKKKKTQEGTQKPVDGEKKPVKTDRSNQPTRIPPPKELEGIPGAQRLPNQKGCRPAWRLPDGGLGEWDSQHGEVEIYDKTGKKHKGAKDPETGEWIKGKEKGDPSRKATRAKFEKVDAEDIQYQTPSPKLDPEQIKKGTQIGVGIILLEILLILVPVG
jgi:RHS repeat-associated protein